MKQLRSYVGAPLLALMCAVVFIGGRVSPASADEAPHDDRPIVITGGHVDLLYVDQENGRFKLLTTESDSKPGDEVKHQSDRVTIGVPSSTKEALPDQLKSLGSEGYVLPMTQKEGVPFPGISLEDLDDVKFKTVTFTFTNVTGPGKIAVSGQDPTGKLTPLLADKSFELKDGSQTILDHAAHQHMYWVFTAPGAYYFSAQATVDLGDGTVKTTNTATFNFAVGDDEVARASQGALVLKGSAGGHDHDHGDHDHGDHDGDHDHGDHDHDHGDHDHGSAAPSGSASASAAGHDHDHGDHDHGDHDKADSHSGGSGTTFLAIGGGVILLIAVIMGVVYALKKKNGSGGVASA